MVQMSEIIESERMLLRPWRIDDMAEAGALFTYASDPQIGLLCGWPPHTSVEGSMNDIRNILAAENSWAITIKDNGGEPAGSISLRPVGRYIIDPVKADAGLQKRYGKFLGSNALEVGYWIGRPFWGKGYMPEALNAVLCYAFDALHKDAVWGAHYVENLRSGRVMAKCGMRNVGETRGRYFPLIDESHDENFRIITSDDWRAESVKVE